MLNVYRKTVLIIALALIAPIASASIILRTGVDAAQVVQSAGTTDSFWDISTDGGNTYNDAIVNYDAQICCNMGTVANTAAWITDSGRAGSGFYRLGRS